MVSLEGLVVAVSRELHGILGATEMKAPYSVTIWSHPDYEHLVAELYVNGDHCGLVSQEGGPNSALSLEVPGAGSVPSALVVNLELFEKAVHEAKRRLLGLDDASTS
jgi:hypothetical protein